jgi:hypothetical protein
MAVVNAFPVRAARECISGSIMRLFEDLGEVLLA